MQEETYTTLSSQATTLTISPSKELSEELSEVSEELASGTSCEVFSCWARTLLSPTNS